MALSSIGDLWNQWNIRGFVILSLFVQIVLVLFGPFRKKTTNHHIIFLLWLAYLMADSVAIYTIGLISHNQGYSSTHMAKVDGALQAFWVSFLLLHLGGPDTITAFSMEDSLLWQRHLLNLIFQISATIYVFAQIFPTNKSLVLPTMLVFLAGVIKNAERILALYFSSLPRLREWALSQTSSSKGTSSSEGAYKNLVQELNVQLGGNSNKEATLAESIVVKHADCFLQILKVFLADFIFKRQEREISREYFCKVSAMDALRVLSVELHFIYEVLHTKAFAIHSNWGYIFRLIAFTNVVIAFVLFNRVKKHRLKEPDVEITYLLLFGGIALDAIALFMLVFSDWMVVKIKRCNTRSSKLDSLLHKLVSTTDYLRKPRFTPCEAKPNANSTYTVLDTPLIFQRWSESISACNLLSEVVKGSPRKIYKRRCWGIVTFSKICKFSSCMAQKIIFCFLQASGTIARGRCLRYIAKKFSKKPLLVVPANVKYVSKNPFIKELWIFIFTEVKRKSENANNQEEVKKIFEARGDRFIRSRPRGISCGSLAKHVTDATYDSSIIRWHVATEIWYNKESSTTQHDKREFSKILSDYMLYLLFNQPNVMSDVAGIAKITSNHVLTQLGVFCKLDEMKAKQLCEECFTKVPKLHQRTELQEAVHLAQEIEKLRDGKWEVISGVWVEMLSYAASHIKGEAHIQVLSKGGELLAFVWLLMAHFGCFYKPVWGMCYEPSDEEGELKQTV
ncbi:uncharacterized protein LOC104455440 [Eucalyptus grandis]|uniref:uncharacterized protein LOC104455440 n=1 Tax=Eucalyptus grandis TaxID=71139 RepID=UPI00192F1122|nr:uncharacterized protein LOC104455440 [Eucalyptus grandis]